MTAEHLLSSHRQALICSPSVDAASESRSIAPTVRRESNVNFLFRLSLEFYRLVSSSVARGSIPNDQRPVRRPLGFHGLAEIKQWNRSRTGNCGKEPSGDRPDGSCYLSAHLGSLGHSRLRSLISASARSQNSKSRSDGRPFCSQISLARAVTACLIRLASRRCCRLCLRS